MLTVAVPKRNKLPNIIVLTPKDGEKKINEDIHACKGKVTCNIGKIIEEIRNDSGE